VGCSATRHAVDHEFGDHQFGPLDDRRRDPPVEYPAHRVTRGGDDVRVVRQTLLDPLRSVATGPDPPARRIAYGAPQGSRRPQRHGARRASHHLSRQS
jgi:hypothetical protein